MPYYCKNRIERVSRLDMNQPPAGNFPVSMRDFRMVSVPRSHEYILYKFPGIDFTFYF